MAFWEKLTGNVSSCCVYSDNDCGNCMLKNVLFQCWCNMGEVGGGVKGGAEGGEKEGGLLMR